MVASIFLSRILGFLREWVLAQTAGASSVADVYLASFTIPDFLNYLMAAGALNISLIPVMAEFVGEGKEEQARKIYRTISTVLSLTMLILILVCQLSARQLAFWVAPGFNAEQLNQLTYLLRLILPAQFFFFWGGMANGVQQTHGKFIYSAIAPLIYNLSIIVFGVCLYSKLGIASFSLGVLVGAFLGYGILQVLGLVRLGYPILPGIYWETEIRKSFQKYLWMSIPIMLAFSLVVADEWISKYLASFMEAGSVSRLSYARTEMRIPIAIIGQAAGIASYPHLSRLWAQKKYQDFSETFIREIQKIWALGPLAAILMLTHAVPITHFIYGGGKLTPYDLQETAKLLQWMGLGVVFWILHIILSRGFYATQTTWLPSLWGSVTTVLFIPVYSLLAKGMGSQGLALAGTLGITFYVGTLSLLLGFHIRKQTREVSFQGVWRFGLSWGAVVILLGLLALGLSKLGIYRETRLSALADILVASAVIGGLALYLLRKSFSHLTKGALF